MPGVPTGRGCDACRKQKKKCDASSGAAPCSRCRRQQITCVGAGQQRYKFQDEGRKLAERNKPKDPPNVTSSELSRTVVNTLPSDKIQAFSTASSVPCSPSNGLNSLTTSFISILSESIDISISLPLNFGGYLYHVPARLGHNAALDAAATVIVAAYTRYFTSKGNPDNDVLVKHSRALVALNTCLSDPVRAKESETLCAVMLLLICQVLMGRRSRPCISHSVGAAQILKSRGYAGPKNEFERILLLTLRGPVVFEALSNPRIRFTPQEWQDLVLAGLGNGSEPIAILARMPELLRLARLALKQSSTVYADSHNTRAGLIGEVAVLYQSYQPILQKLRTRCESLETKVLCNASLTSIQKRTIHCRCSSGLAIGLAIGIAINHLWSVLGGGYASLQLETTRMSEQILALEEVFRAYRPLGAMTMLISLGAAWMGTRDKDVKAWIEQLSIKYMSDIDGESAGVIEEDLGLWRDLRS